MKTIVINNKISFDLDLVEELRVKDMRKIQNIKTENLNSIDFTILIVKTFSIDPTCKFLVDWAEKEIWEAIDNMNIEEYKELDNKISEIFNFSQDKKK